MGRWTEKQDQLTLSSRRIAHGVLGGALGVILSPLRFFKLFCFAIGFTVLLLGVITIVSIHSFLQSLPQIDQLDMRNVEMIARARVSERMERTDKRVNWMGLKEISREFMYAIVYSEDSTFFEHEGFNFEAIANSLAENIKERKVMFGGSTISQQVVKNLFLTPERTVSRKLKEFILTRDLETRFSKNEILEIYLNIAELGPDTYGVGEAAWRYFRKHPMDINAAEGAFIALMLPSPKRNYYSIYQNRNLTKIKKRRIERVLRDMVYEELLSEKQYQKYVKYNYFPEPKRAPATTGRRE